MFGAQQGSGAASVEKVRGAANRRQLAASTDTDKTAWRLVSSLGPRRVWRKTVYCAAGLAPRKLYF